MVIMLLTPIRSFEAAIDGLPPVAGSARPYVAVDLAWEIPGASVRAASDQADASESDRDPIEYRCALVVLGDDDAEVARLDVSFSERVMTAARSRLLGLDASGSLHADVEADLPPRSVRLQFRFHPDASARPEDLLPAIGVIEAFREGRRIGLWSHTTSRWAAGPVTIPADHPGLPDGYASTVKLFARVQQRTGQPFPMPAELDDSDADAIRRADALLSGNPVSGHWQNATLVLEREGLAFIESASSASGARLDFTSDYVVAIAGHTIPLGPAEDRQVFVDGTAPGPEAGLVEVRLRAGDIDRVEIHLLGTRELDRTSADGDADALDQYAGQWIAQSGNEIVAVADTAKAVAAELRRPAGVPPSGESPLPAGRQRRRSECDPAVHGHAARTSRSKTRACRSRASSTRAP